MYAQILRMLTCFQASFRFVQSLHILSDFKVTSGYYFISPRKGWYSRYWVGIFKCIFGYLSAYLLCRSRNPSFLLRFFPKIRFFLVIIMNFSSPLVWRRSAKVIIGKWNRKHNNDDGACTERLLVGEPGVVHTSVIFLSRCTHTHYYK